MGNFRRGGQEYDANPLRFHDFRVAGKGMGAVRVEQAGHGAGIGAMLQENRLHLGGGAKGCGRVPRHYTRDIQRCQLSGTCVFIRSYE